MRRCTFQSMVTQGGSAVQSHAKGDELPDMNPIAKWFINEVTWYAIHSCILGVVMFFGTYLSILSFNYAAHSQVSFQFKKSNVSASGEPLCYTFVILVG